VGECSRDGYSAQFFLGTEAVVQEVGLDLHGQTELADAPLMELERRTGWVVIDPPIAVPGLPPAPQSAEAIRAEDDAFYSRRAWARNGPVRDAATRAVNGARWS
jgi:hypothetical protein